MNSVVFNKVVELTGVQKQSGEDMVKAVKDFEKAFGVTKESIEKRIKELEQEDFIIGVSSDFLSADDHYRLGKINDEIRALKKILAEME